MLTTAARWESRRILKHTPGRSGLLPVVLLAVLFLAPWQHLGFATALEGILLFGWIFAIATAANVAADAGEIGESAFWLYQKGISIADYALAKCITAAAWGIGLIGFGSALGLLGLALHGELYPRTAAVLIGSCGLLFTLVLALYFLGGALRLERKTEILLVLALIAVLQNLLFRAVPPAVRRAVHLVLPPFEHASGVPAALLGRQWAHAIAGTLHVVLFVFACLGCASLLHRRWRPLH